eukprot:764243-Hanusia_phi.AAC.2
MSAEDLGRGVVGDLRALEVNLQQIKVAAADEGNEWVSAEDVNNADYVINKDAEEELMKGNDGRWTTRDKARSELRRSSRANRLFQGHTGYTLDYFHNHSYARTAQLHKRRKEGARENRSRTDRVNAKVAALRLYTTSTFRGINGPLRAKTNPHPL